MSSTGSTGDPQASKKAVAKKSTAKKAARNATPAKRKPVKKKAAKKGVTKKKAPAKKAAKKKAPAKKAAKKKAPAKKATKGRRPSAITDRVSRKRPATRSRAQKPMIGWREWVILPDFSPTPIKAKVDTGAVTSALHAFNLKLTTDRNGTIARFGVAPRQGLHAAKTTVECPVVGFKRVRSSNGQTELRPVVRTSVIIGDKSFEIDITLASRDEMGFRMLLGRRAVRKRFLIDPGRSFLQPAADDGPSTDQ